MSAWKYGIPREKNKEKVRVIAKRALSIAQTCTRISDVNVIDLMRQSPFSSLCNVDIGVSFQMKMRGNATEHMLKLPLVLNSARLAELIRTETELNTSRIITKHEFAIFHLWQLLWILSLQTEFFHETVFKNVWSYMTVWVSPCQLALHIRFSLNYLSDASFHWLGVPVSNIISYSLLKHMLMQESDGFWSTK